MSRTCLSSIAFFVIAASLVVGVPRAPHKSKHKHYSRLNDNALSDIRLAFHDFRGAESRRFADALSTEIAKDDENDAIDNHHLRRESFHSRNSASHHHIARQNAPHDLRNRRHRHHHQASSTTPTTAATAVKSDRTAPNSHNDDDEDDYYDDPSSLQYGLNTPHATANSRSNRVIRHDHHQQASGSESLTDFKLKTLSSRDGVEKSFQAYVEENPKEKEKLVMQHVKRFKIDAKCQWPSRRIQDAPSPSYTPRKYVVFKCSDDTACCHSHEETCVAKNSNYIDLWFRVGQGFEKLAVKNDTECHCVKFEKLNQSRAKSLEPLMGTSKKSLVKCKCPSNFDAQIDAEGCNCNCFELQSECRLRYEGKEGFTLSDQSCIQRGDCTMPHCLHGMFSTMRGRCPDEHDKYNASFTRTRRSR